MLRPGWGWPRRLSRAPPPCMQFADSDTADAAVVPSKLGGQAGGRRVSPVLLLRAWPGAGERGRPGERADGRLQFQNLLGRLARCLPLPMSFLKSHTAGWFMTKREPIVKHSAWG